MCVCVPNKNNKNITMTGVNSQADRLQAGFEAAKKNMCNSINLPRGSYNLTEFIANYSRYTLEILYFKRH